MPWAIFRFWALAGVTPTSCGVVISTTAAATAVNAFLIMNSFRIASLLPRWMPVSCTDAKALIELSLRSSYDGPSYDGRRHRHQHGRIDPNQSGEYRSELKPCVALGLAFLIILAMSPRPGWSKLLTVQNLPLWPNRFTQPH